MILLRSKKKIDEVSISIEELCTSLLVNMYSPKLILTKHSDLLTIIMKFTLCEHFVKKLHPIYLEEIMNMVLRLISSLVEAYSNC